ncbi:MAG: imidazole glycerol phosphate synthase cyclase subunit [Alphaproteobacteria bacterium]|nr:imidazole glycerol phosphate synthase cyclase subunit [Alphaproteobacteria bacterium]
MSRIRVIARLDIKGPNLIKGIHLEGLRVIGDPYEYAKKYYQQGADELIYMDSVASLYNRNNLTQFVEKAAKGIFVPMTVGGGVRSVDDAMTLFLVGADKVAINTAAVANKQLISDMANRFGSQAMVLSIEAKSKTSGGWEAMTDNGREHTGLDVVEWAKEAVSLGAGEILLTSIDQEGTQKGFNVDLVRAVAKAVPVPVIASGGMGTLAHASDVVEKGAADAIAVAHMLHYNKTTIGAVKDHLAQGHIEVSRRAA